MEKREYQRVMQILGEAIARAPAEREAWLNSACAGDESLHKQVLKLIAHEKTAPDFMEESPFENAVWREREERSLIGSQIGAYKIVEEIGRGGMGAVYLAQRADKEFESLVSVKIIKRGMDTDYILHSFRKERQILAYLNHPNIARLLDGGTSEDGRPYFIMEYIKGQSIKRYCDEKKLTIEERLKLFLKVCSAAQYAHQNLIVHRDLKPSNILVTEDGMPKLLDFGVAKLLSSDNSNQEQTAANARAMTPEYASPEQIRGEPVTTASDIYSLGVILYELLTGRRPYSFEGRSQAEVAQLISKQEPEKPSTVITHAQAKTGTDDIEKGQTLPEQIGLARRSTPAELSRRLRGDLDNIILMAMRKESARRYASIEQFSEDIERHLSGLPVRARQDTFSYRASKFIRRNRVGAAAATIVLLTLIGGVLATLRQTHVARVERAKAERRFNEVRRLADSFMFELNDAKEASERCRQALAVFRELAAADPLNVETQYDVAQSYLRIGEALKRTGDANGALENLRAALPIFQSISERSPINAKIQRDLALTYLELGDTTAKIAVTAKLSSAKRAEQWREARDAYQKSLDIYQEMKNKGTISRADAGKINALAVDIAKCDAALKMFGAD
jgi:serine/threonine protein kinase